MEEWKSIKGYEGLYMISNIGNVKHIKFKKHRYMKLNLYDRYPKVILTKENNKKSYNVHRLVAMHFVSNPENKPHVNHKDGIRTNCQAENLEWVTHKENMRHAHDTGLIKYKLTDKEVEEIITMKEEGFTHQFIGEKFGVTGSYVGELAKGRYRNIQKGEFNHE